MIYSDRNEHDNFITHSVIAARFVLYFIWYVYIKICFQETAVNIYFNRSCFYTNQTKSFKK